MLPKSLNLLVVAIFTLLLLSCTSSPKISFNDASDERMVSLTEELSQQRKKIEYLTIEMKALQKELRLRPTAAVVNGKIAPPEKAKGKVTLGKTSQQVKKASAQKQSVRRTETDPDGEVIADSSFENLHLYYAGLQAKKDRKFDQATHAFRQFLQSNSDHVYADRAQYLIVECLFLNREYQLSIVAANQLLSREDESLRAPDALFYRAMSYRELGQKSEARDGLKELVNRFPKSPRIKEARVYLTELSDARSASLPPQLLDRTTQ